MRRRDFLGVLGGTAAAWPVAATAQSSAMPVIGLLHGGSAEGFAHALNEFRKALSEAGFIEGRTVRIEYQFADGRYAQLSAMAEELVRLGVSVIVALPNSPARAAKIATASIPIIFFVADDPVAMGLVASYNRPGQNATGFTNFNTNLEPKRLSLLLSAVPTARKVALLVNASSRSSAVQIKDIQESTSKLGLSLIVATASNASEYEASFSRFVEENADVLVVAADPVFIADRLKLVQLAAKSRLPAIYTVREYVTAGGLFSYGDSLADGYRQLAIYTGRILKGEKPSDLPVVRSSRFEFLINLKAAKEIGLEIPYGLLVAADGVIE